MNLSKRMMNDLDRDIEEHIAMETQDNIDRGMSPEEARYAALRKFGNVVRAKEETRAVWIVLWLEELMQDIRFGLRTFRKSPGFVAVAILTLALGIGANTAIFSLLDAVMLRALPVDKPSELVVLEWRARSMPKVHGYGSYGDCPTTDMSYGAKNPSGCSFSEPLLREIEQAKIFSGTAAFANAGRLALTGNGPASTAQCQLVSGDFFHTLGLKPAAGRLFLASDDTPSAAPVTVLNYGYWQSAFGGSHDVVGRTVELNGVPFTIVGVVESRFAGITPGSDYDLWLPLADEHRIAPTGFFTRPERRGDAGQWWMTIVARLDPAKSLAQTQVVTTGLFRNHTLHGAEPLFDSGEAPAPQPQVIHQEVTNRATPQPLGKTPVRMPLSPPGMVAKPLKPAAITSSAKTTPVADNPEIALLPVQTTLTGNRSIYANPLYVLMMAVGIILLIACANVAGLMLARAATRQKEMAVRMALGAGRIRIVRQLLTESVMLSIFGATLGVLFAYWGAYSIVAFVSRVGIRELGLITASVDFRVLLFTLAITIASGILFGIAPAFRSVRADLAPALKEGEGSSKSPKRHRARWLSTNNALVVSQMALAMVLLVGAGLLVRTLQNLRSVDVGFDAHNIVIFSLNPELAGYKGEQVESFYRDVQGRFAETPGVQSASYSMGALLSGGLMMTMFHWPGTPEGENSRSDVLNVGPNFFATMHIPFLAGRNFTNGDFVLASADATPGHISVPTPVIVNRTFVEKFLGKENPMSKQFGEFAGDKYRPKSAGYEIIGVVGDTKYSELRREINPMMFTPQVAGPAAFELRTAADPQGLLPVIRKVVAEVNTNMPLFDVQTESEQIDRMLFRERLVARLATFFSALALLLACIGLYGLLSYDVARRRREIGIRMALGAQVRDVLRLIVRQGIALALVGAAVGIGIALAITRYLTSMLYNIHANDPWTMIAVAVLLSLISLAACFIPARRATRLDPMITLRNE